MESICVVDPICRNNAHFLFNSSILRALKVNHKKIIFWCYKSNNLIIDEGVNCGIKVRVVQDIDNHIYNVVILLSKLFRSKEYYSSRKIVFLAIDNSVIPVLFLLNFYLIPFSYNRITIISHNNLYTIKNSLIKRQLFMLFLSAYHPKVVLLSPIFGESFRKATNYRNVVGVLHQNFKRTIAENFDLSSNKVGSRFDKSRINIFVSGSHSEFFKEFICSNTEKIRKITTELKRTVIFKYVSNVSVEFDKIGNLYLERIDRPDNLKNYFILISMADFVFFPIDEITNTRASGVLMDALTVGTDFIAPDTGHFRDINSRYGFGYLYTNFLEFFSIVINLSNDSRLSRNKALDLTQFYIDTDPRKICEIF